MNKCLWASVAFGAIALFCFLTYALVGVRVDEQGFLREPFLLLPIGWLSSFVSGIFLLAGFASKV